MSTNFNYYHEVTNTVKTPTVFNLEYPDLNTDNKIRKAGYVKIYYVYPDHDSALYTLTPKDSLTKAEDGINYNQEFNIVPLDLAQAKANLKNKATNRRWEILNGGLSIPDVGTFTTDDQDQLRITSANVGASLEQKLLQKNDKIDFKAQSGWIQIEAAQLEQIGLMIFKFGQACFSNEKALHDKIDAAKSVKALASINLEEGWPEGAVAVQKPQE